MHTVRVKKATLLERIQKNRNDHAQLFAEAQRQFRQRVIEELDEMLADARSLKPLRMVVGLEAPQDHTADYDRVIDMLTNSEDEVIEMDAVTYDQLMRNNWAWFHAVTATNALYASGGKLKV